MAKIRNTMKRIIKYALLLAIVATVSSCMEEVGDFTIKGEAITGFELSTPVNSASVRINTGTPTEIFVFSWNQAESGLGSPLKYTILFDVPDGNFSNPKWSKVSDNSGAATKATLTFLELQQILTAAGSGGTVKWNIKAENGSPNVKMAQVASLLKLSSSTAGISNFNLISPLDKSILQLDGTHENDTLKFDWANATTTSGTLTYKFYLDKVGGDFSNPLLTLDGDVNGAASQVSMTQGQWKALLEQNGITKGSYIWTAKAISSDLQWMKVSFNIYIEFVNWRSPIYIVGEATSVGWDINNALEMAFVSPNLWTGTFLLKAGKEFKFFPKKGSWDNGVGADRFTTFIGCAGTSGGNIQNNGATDRYYLVVVDLNTKTVTVADNPKILGGSVIADWNPSAAVPMQMVEPGIFDTYQYITVDGYGFKLVPSNSGWDGDFGKSKTVAGFLAQADEDNLTVPADGFYRVRTNFNDMSYSVVATSWGVIGDATPGGWGTDTNMSFTAAKGQYTWKVDIALTAGGFKFRANDDWGINLGDDGANGSLEYNGSNIAVTAGNYHIELILNSATGFTYTVTKK
jgi:hypothetical protein